MTILKHIVLIISYAWCFIIVGLAKHVLFFILKLYGLDTVVLIYKTSLSLISIQRKRDLMINLFIIQG